LIVGVGTPDENGIISKGKELLGHVSSIDFLRLLLILAILESCLLIELNFCILPINSLQEEDVKKDLYNLYI